MYIPGVGNDCSESRLRLMSAGTDLPKGISVVDTLVALLGRGFLEVRHAGRSGEWVESPREVRKLTALTRMNFWKRHTVTTFFIIPVPLARI